MTKMLGYQYGTLEPMVEIKAGATTDLVAGDALPLWRTMRGELPEHGTKVIVAFLRSDLTYRKRLCSLSNEGIWSNSKSKETAVYWMPLPNDPPFPVECRPARKNFLKRIFKTL